MDAGAIHHATTCRYVQNVIMFNIRILGKIHAGAPCKHACTYHFGFHPMFLDVLRTKTSEMWWSSCRFRRALLKLEYIFFYALEVYHLITLCCHLPGNSDVADNGTYVIIIPCSVILNMPVKIMLVSLHVLK